MIPLISHTEVTKLQTRRINKTVEGVLGIQTGSKKHSSKVIEQLSYFDCRTSLPKSIQGTEKLQKTMLTHTNASLKTKEIRHAVTRNVPDISDAQILILC